MARGSILLGGCPWLLVRLHCPECHRFAQFGRAGLVARFGADLAMPDLLVKLRPCGRPSIGVAARPCQLAYWGSMRRHEGAGAGRPAEGRRIEGG